MIGNIMSMNGSVVPAVYGPTSVSAGGPLYTSMAFMLVNIAAWCDSTGGNVIPCDDPGNSTIGYTTASDDDMRYWAVRMSDVRICGFFKSRPNISYLVNTPSGRNKLTEHIETCSICLPDSVHNS